MILNWDGGLKKIEFKPKRMCIGWIIKINWSLQEHLMLLGHPSEKMLGKADELDWK